MQRVRLKAERNIGFSATVSARALNVEGTSFDVVTSPKFFLIPAITKAWGALSEPGQVVRGLSEEERDG
jgi:hypothetical protein